MDRHLNPNKAADPIELEVFRHLFSAVAEEMGARLMRAAFSPNIKERRDFSCAVLDVNGQLLAQAAHIPVHLGSMPMSAAAILEGFPATTMQPGDIFVVNDPFAGGTHLPDITVLAPVFIDGDQVPRFLAANRAHHSDIGGISPGSMPVSTHIDEEGIRLSPARMDSAMRGRICSASRTPDERLGDLMAQEASLQVGCERMVELCRSYGGQHVTAMGEQLVAYSERVMRGVIDGIADGDYQAVDYLDDDGFGNDDIEIRCSLSIHGDCARVDFTGSAPQVRGPLNAVRAITMSAVNYVFRCIAPAELPTNAGVMRPVEVLTQPGSVVDAQYPAAVAAGNVETSQRIVDVLLAALAQAMQTIPAASQGTMNNLAIGGEGFSYYETTGGGCGAGPAYDGESAVHSHMTNTLNTPVEALEHAYPLTVRRYSLRRESGGDGKHRGGDGIVRCLEANADCEAVLLTERRRRGAYGLNGGADGQPGENLLVRAGEEPTTLPGKSTVQLKRGDRLEIKTPGGGGWGDADGP